MQLLTKNEEEYYLERLKDEEEEIRLEAKQILIERNLRLVSHIAKKYQSTEADMKRTVAIGRQNFASIREEN